MIGLYASSPRRRVAAAITLIALLALPWLMQTLDQSFYVSLASRVLIFALAATSLNLVIGFGGMVSFGHAAFFGAGAYTVAILAENGVVSAALAWPLALTVAALLALLIGALSPVSYTHLDVYKRQLSGMPPSSAPVLIRRPSSPRTVWFLPRWRGRWRSLLPPCWRC